MNYLLKISFNGQAYHGFQVQKNALTVCEVLQNAMEGLLGTRPPVKGCSRTDAGVHALGYALSFFADTRIPPAKLPAALNHLLPGDIRVRAAQVVPNGFHARYSAIGKEYGYHLLNAPTDDPLRQGYYHRVTPPLDERRMRRAGLALLGRHDFAAFCAAGGGQQDTVRTVQYLGVRREGEYVTITISADGFLYNMVRIIAGTLMRVGTGRLPEDAVRRILLSRDRAAAAETLPAGGLVLNRVFYPFGLGFD